MQRDTDRFPLLPGRSGEGAASGGRRFPLAAKKRGLLAALAENKEPAGLPAAPEPGNGRRPVGGRGGGSVLRSRQLHAAGPRLPPAGGAPPAPQPFVRRPPCWEPFLVPAPQAAAGAAEAGGRGGSGSGRGAESGALGGGSRGRLSGGRAEEVAACSQLVTDL